VKEKHNRAFLETHPVVIDLCCYMRSQNCEKRLLSVPHRKTGLPLNEFSWNFIFDCFSKICWEVSSL